MSNMQNVDTLISVLLVSFIVSKIAAFVTFTTEQGQICEFVTRFYLTSKCGVLVKPLVCAKCFCFWFGVFLSLVTFNFVFVLVGCVAGGWQK